MIKLGPETDRALFQIGGSADYWAGVRQQIVDYGGVVPELAGYDTPEGTGATPNQQATPEADVFVRPAVPAAGHVGIRGAFA